jgi:hypothetical protein
VFDIVDVHNCSPHASAYLQLSDFQDGIFTDHPAVRGTFAAAPQSPLWFGNGTVLLHNLKKAVENQSLPHGGYEKTDNAGRGVGVTSKL